MTNIIGASSEVVVLGMVSIIGTKICLLWKKMSMIEQHGSVKLFDNTCMTSLKVRPCIPKALKKF